MKILTTEQMRDLDRQTVQKGVSEKKLISSAGSAVARWISENYPRDKWKILSLIGKGNNGADAAVAAARLKKQKYRVRMVRGWEKEALKKVRLEMISKGAGGEAVLLLDGLFGTGLNRPLAEPYLSLVSFLGDPSATGHRRWAIISIDIPSGLHSDTGEPMGASIRADHTLAMGLPKFGLVRESAADFVGKLHVLEIGFPQDLIKKISTPCRLITPQNVTRAFGKRKWNVHKGDLGHLLVVGGSTGMAGAPALASRAALRTGSGLVTILAPASVAPACAALAGPEIMVHPAREEEGVLCPKSLVGIETLLERATALVLGPGIGRRSATLEMIRSLFKKIKIPLLVDADALFLISENTGILKSLKSETILTPHPGEMARLVGKTVKEVQADRFGISSAFAREHGVTVVLKGARTVVAHPEPVLFNDSRQETGPGQRPRLEAGFQFSVNALAGNPGMATAGCGDALSGIIGSLLGRGISAKDAACAGVFLHARAGDLALPCEGGGIVTDLIGALPQAFLSIIRH